VPLFLFGCGCGNQVEKLQKYGDPPPSCESCAQLPDQDGPPMDRKPALTSFSLKGDGWAKDNYGLRGK
jgi:hypothetical protein